MEQTKRRATNRAYVKRIIHSDPVSKMILQELNSQPTLLGAAIEIVRSVKNITDLLPASADCTKTLTPTVKSLYDLLEKTLVRVDLPFIYGKQGGDLIAETPWYILTHNKDVNCFRIREYVRSWTALHPSLFNHQTKGAEETENVSLIIGLIFISTNQIIRKEFQEYVQDRHNKAQQSARYKKALFRS